MIRVLSKKAAKVRQKMKEKSKTFNRVITLDKLRLRGDVTIKRRDINAAEG